MTTLLTKRAVAGLVGLHGESIMRLVREGRFPAPIRPGGDNPRAHVRFVKSEIDAWLEQRKAARKPATREAA